MHVAGKIMCLSCTNGVILLNSNIFCLSVAIAFIVVLAIKKWRATVIVKAVNIYLCMMCMY